MNNGKSMPVGVLAIYLGATMAYLTLIALERPLFGAIFGAVAGSVFIFVVVRRVNHRRKRRPLEPGRGCDPGD
jgi:hypothetical protein